MSKVFSGILLRRIEALESHPEVRWPERLDTLEARRDWRLTLAGRNWNIFSCRRLSKSGFNCLSKSGQVFTIFKAA